MRFFSTLVLLIYFSSSYAQNGYLITTEGTKIEGFLRDHRSMETGELQIELWKTKKDKNPKIYDFDQITDFAIKKDTFTVLINLYPFEDEKVHFDIIPARIIVRGTVDLLVIEQKYNPTIATTMGGGLIPAIIDESVGNYNGPLYILRHNSKGLLRGPKHKKNEFANSVNEFFEDDFSLMKKIINKEYRFKDLEKIVNEYNIDH